MRRLEDGGVDCQGEDIRTVGRLERRVKFAREKEQNFLDSGQARLPALRSQQKR